MKYLFKVFLKRSTHFFSILFNGSPNNLDLAKKIVKPVLKVIVKPVLKVIVKTPAKRFLIQSRLLDFRIKEICLPQPTSYSSTSEKKFKSANGINYLLTLHNYNDWRVYFNIFPKHTHNLFDSVKGNDVVLDIGANIGYYTLNFAQKAKHGIVYSFEPSKETYKRLQKNILGNDHKNIRTFNIGLGNQNSTAYLNLANAHNSGTNYVSEQCLHEANSSSIELVRLDDFVHHLSLNKIDLIKIDIEGYEINCINGATETILKYRPNIYIEIADQHLCRSGYSAKELIFLLENLGYEIYNLDKKRKVTSETFLEGCFFDALCKPIKL